MKLPLRDERGGGRKEKRHVPHHLFDQRLYSTIHSYLATLANYNFYMSQWGKFPYHDPIYRSLINCYLDAIYVSYNASFGIFCLPYTWAQENYRALPCITVHYRAQPCKISR